MSSASRPAWGHGLASVHLASGQVLDTWFPEPHLGERADAPCPAELTAAQETDSVRGVETRVVTVEIDLDEPPRDVPDAYLRLHLLSHRLTPPRSINLDGIFGVLPNVVWTNRGPCAVEGFELTRAALRAAGRNVTVLGVDKFPRMTDYVVPAGVRIADAGRVRLGAHLADGTTVMHEGFCNFNAGTLGHSMVEGRITQGVIVGDGTDVGGGASIMGTLSGGGKEMVTIGKSCLLGAESGVGISLGDNCVIEAGLYLTAGTKVQLPDGSVVKALELSGQPDILYIRHSQTGAVMAKPRGGGRGIELNAALHVN